MIGVGLCLLAGRVLNVLTPRQVGIVTDALITSDGKYACIWLNHMGADLYL